MYRCLMCGAAFEEPFHEPAGMFMYNPMVHEVCPECGDDCIEEIEQDDDDDIEEVDEEDEDVSPFEG